MHRLVQKTWSEHRPKANPLSSSYSHNLFKSSTKQHLARNDFLLLFLVFLDQVRRLRLSDSLWPLFSSCSCPSFTLVVGKTTLAKVVAEGLNNIHSEQAPGCASTPIATCVPMDGYHLSRAQLSAMPDPVTAHHRRGAAFTFDDKAFFELVKMLRKPLLPESTTVYAPSFDHAIKDPVPDDIPIPPASRVVILEGNYLSLNQGLWKEAAELMDELWFVEVDLETARRRLVVRHVAAGIVEDEDEAGKRVDEIDIVNGRQIMDRRMEIQEIISSKEDKTWRPRG